MIDPLLFSDEVRRAIDERIEDDPHRIALDKRLPHAALVAAQVAALQRHRRKLPSYYDARCILPLLAAEQASSEATAAAKGLTGGWCIDLTCGLGVDSLVLSRNFWRVTSIERDEGLAEAARENFRRLGVSNIEVVCSPAEEFIQKLLSENLHPDVIYADPDRRGAKGEKRVLLEECSPDVRALFPALKRIAPHIVVKCSPMFDVAEGARVFGCPTAVEVISFAGECKEVLLSAGEAVTRPVLKAVALGLGAFEGGEEYAAAARPGVLGFAMLPDAALRHARLVEEYFASQGIWCNAGVGFSVGDPGAVIGRRYRILGQREFAPKELARELRRERVRRADIIVRGYDRSPAEVARMLGVAEGGEKCLLVSVLDGVAVVFELLKVL